MKVVFPFDIAKLAIKIYKENEPKTPYSTEISCILLTEKGFTILKIYFK